MHLTAYPYFLKNTEHGYAKRVKIMKCNATPRNQSPHFHFCGFDGWKNQVGRQAEHQLILIHVKQNVPKTRLLIIPGLNFHYLVPNFYDFLRLVF